MPKIDEMLNRVPPFWAGLREYKEIIQSEAPEMEELASKIDDLLNQSFVETATWRMRDWEDEVGMVSSQNEDIEVRRAKVLAKLSSSPPLTYNRLRLIVNQFLDNKNTEVFRVKGEDAVNVIIPLRELNWNRYKSVKRTVDDLIPSHIEVLFFVSDGDVIYPIKIDQGRITIAPMIKFYMGIGRGAVVRGLTSIAMKNKKGTSNQSFSSEIRCGDIKVTSSLSKVEDNYIEIPVNYHKGYALINTIKTRETQHSKTAGADSLLAAKMITGSTKLNVCGETYSQKGGR